MSTFIKGNPSATPAAGTGLAYDQGTGTYAPTTSPVATQDDLDNFAPAVADSPTFSGTYVASPEVRRIVAAELGTTPTLQDGDMVVYYTRPGGHYYTDFSDQTAGAAPAGWSQPWHNEPTWTVENVAGSTGGKVLKVDPSAAPGTGNWSLIAWDAIEGDPDRADVELLVRMRATQADTYPPSLILRGSGTNATRTSYRLGHIGQTAMHIRRFDNGTSYDVNLGPVTTEDINLDWFYVRARVEGTTQALRSWKEGEVEPTTWDAFTTSTALSGVAGKVGIVMHELNLARWEIDWVAAATAGRTAVPL